MIMLEALLRLILSCLLMVIGGVVYVAAWALSLVVFVIMIVFFPFAKEAIYERLRARQRRRHAQTAEERKNNAYWRA